MAKAHIPELDPEEYTIAERRKIVAEHIVRYPRKFMMKDYTGSAVEKNECGTVGCIAGWTCFVFDRAAYKSDSTTVLVESATHILGLGHNEADDLFHGRCPVWPDWMDLSRITAKEAATKLLEME